MNRSSKVGREGEAASRRVLLDHLLEPRLVDRNLVPLETFDLRRVFVDANHTLTGSGKARAQ
jgi:hypothetical protein